MSILDNNDTIQNLYNVLQRVYTKNNLLILDPSLTSLVNYLTSFSKLKQFGKINSTLLLSDYSRDNSLESFDGLVLLIDLNWDNIPRLLDIVNNSSKKVYVIVKDINKLFIYQLNSNFDSSIDLLAETFIISKTKFFNWRTLPILTNDIFLTLDSIDSYFEDPIKLVNLLSDALILIFGKFPIFKFKNSFAKGNHSNVLLKSISQVKLPQYLSTNLTPGELDFYNHKFISNTDLVILERNLDWSSVVLDQLNYQGLIDDLFDTNFNQTTIDDEKFSLNDDLYPHLKDFNFSAIGSKLNKLAKSIQSQQKDINKNSMELSEMKKLVSTLGNITQQQDLIKKHTLISESILSTISEDESFLNYQNDVFNLDYKSQLQQINQFFLQVIKLENVISAIVLLSITNDGVKQKDYDFFLTNLQENYGLLAVLLVEKLLKYKIIRLNTETESFLGFGKKESTINFDSNIEKIGITGGVDIYKSNYTLIDKFWNLHPEDEDEATIVGEKLIETYSNPSFTLPSKTVPLMYRIIESLYYRDFLKYKPVGNLKNRPNWDNLGLDTMFDGDTVDINNDDQLDSRLKRIERNEKGDINGKGLKNQEFLILIFIGGITYGEIACLQYLQQKFDRGKINKKIFILSNGIVNKKRLIEFAKE